jgi:hypothetical protein
MVPTVNRDLAEQLLHDETTTHKKKPKQTDENKVLIISFVNF